MKKVQKYLKAHNLFEDLMFKAGLQYMGLNKIELKALESNPEFFRVLSEVEGKFPDTYVEFKFIAQYWCYHVRMCRLVEYGPVAELIPPPFDKNPKDGLKKGQKVCVHYTYENYSYVKTPVIGIVRDDSEYGQFQVTLESGEIIEANDNHVTLVDDKEFTPPFFDENANENLPW